MPKVSVLIIAYNSEKFIEEAVRSVMTQTFKDFELVVVEDGSKDGTWSKLEELEKEIGDKRFRIYTNIVNKGVEYSRQRTLKESKGEYIAILDSDDVCMSNRLEIQNKHLDSNSSVVAVASWAGVIDEHSNFVRNSSWMASAEHIYYNLHFRNCLTHSSLMYRRSILEKIGGFTLNFAEDYDVFTKIMRFGRLEILPEYLVKWRHSSTQATAVHEQDLWESACKISQNALEKTLGKKVKYELVCGIQDLKYFSELSRLEQQKSIDLLVESSAKIIESCPTYLNKKELKHRAIFNELRFVLYAKTKGFKGDYKSLLKPTLWEKICMQFQKRPFRYAPGITRLLNRDYFL